ncbi:hypothetical protein PPS11_07110 [Pseudomonas putida S11]|nr:hypothetical protein PPS11_07110 [Pseudomonas putida S11]
MLEQGLQPDQPRPFTHQAVRRQWRQTMTYAQALTRLCHRHASGRVIHKLLLDTAQTSHQLQVFAKGIALGQLLQARGAQFEQVWRGAGAETAASLPTLRSARVRVSCSSAHPSFRP